ncbi:DALR anticodon-binding domain-containing protein [Streptosporangium soli]|nr:anticodon-binding protein [Streptosporangium sp. KLBMP 9127]
MTPAQLAEILGEPPEPVGSWEREAVYRSAAALRAREPGARLAALVRPLPGISEVRVVAGGFLEIVVAEPGTLVEEITGAEITGGPAAGWPDLPRTWDNPGFVVRYGLARAVAVRRWARDLGVPSGPFEPASLTDPRDRAVLRVLAELPGRRSSRDAGWPGYLVRLALAYHDAHERAPAVPRGDEAVGTVHIARVRLAGAVRLVLAGGLPAVGQTTSERV